MATAARTTYGKRKDVGDLESDTKKSEREREQ